MAKIFIATPAFSGQVYVEYAIALAQTCTMLSHHGHDTVIRIHASGSLLVAERNNLVTAFLESDCTHMFCIDNDLAWQPEAVLNMLMHDKDFMAGCYPARKKPGTFHFVGVENEDGSLVLEDNLIKMKYVPAGFMMIKRCVLEGMKRHFPELYYTPIDERSDETPGVALFNTELFEGHFYGEDYVFCRRARQAGYDIYVDPRYNFNHAGTVGKLEDHLTNDESKHVKGIADKML